MKNPGYNFLDFGSVEDSKNANVMIGDIIGVLIGVLINVRQPLSIKVGKNASRNTNKREITLIDGRSNTLKVALWGDLADNEGQILSEKLSQNPIVIVSNVNGNFSVTSTMISTMEINPAIIDADELQQRFKSFVCGKHVLHILPPTKRMREASMVDLKSIIDGNVDDLFCTFKATIINNEQPWYENCKMYNGRVCSGMDNDTTLCDKCENKKASFIRKPMLKLVVSNGIDEAYVTPFDASDYLIGCTVSEYAQDMKKSEYYRNLVTCQGGEYIFLVKMEKKKRARQGKKVYNCTRDTKT